MKFTCASEINLSPDKAAALFISPDHLKEWQKNLISHEVLTGNPVRPVLSFQKGLFPVNYLL